MIMTIKQLIEALSHLDQDAEVFVGDVEDGMSKVREVSGLFDFTEATRPSIYLLGSRNIGSAVFYKEKE